MHPIIIPIILYIIQERKQKIRYWKKTRFVVEAIYDAILIITSRGEKKDKRKRSVSPSTFLSIRVKVTYRVQIPDGRAN